MVSSSSGASVDDAAAAVDDVDEELGGWVVELGEEVVIVTSGSPMIRRIILYADAALSLAIYISSNSTSNKRSQSPQTLEHWLHTCPATHLQRLQILGSADPPLDILTTDPLQVILYARQTSLVTRDVAPNNSSCSSSDMHRRQWPKVLRMRYQKMLIWLKRKFS